MAIEQEDMRALEEEIKAREKLLNEQPREVSSRIISLKAYPNEIVKRIQQIDGVIVEFERQI